MEKRDREVSKMNAKKIVLTGGGTAGHVTPNLALVPRLQEAGFQVFYVGSKGGMEEQLVKQAGLPYEGISSGKLRRYLSKDNVTDVFRVMKGIVEADQVLKKIKPALVFSKGGFVAVPVVLAAKKRGIPVVAHESDLTPGLANKIAMPFAKAVCTTFPETVAHIKGGKGICTGTPIRQELFAGSRSEGLRFLGFTEEKPVLLVMGGSMGSVKINNCLRSVLPHLLAHYQIAHLCGKGNLDDRFASLVGYRQMEYLSDELPHVFAACDGVIARAGSNSISEFLALQIPSLLIPLSAKASRGDQILNAKSFEAQGFSLVLEEEKMDGQSLQAMTAQLFLQAPTLKQAMANSPQKDGVSAVMAVLEETLRKM